MTGVSYRLFGASVYGWIACLVAGLLMAGCGDNFIVDDLVEDAPCPEYDHLVRPWGTAAVPSLTPADYGVRIVVPDAGFVSFYGASYPVPGGRLAWSAWIYHQASGDRLGAVGIVGDGMCRWYDAQ